MGCDTTWPPLHVISLTFAIVALSIGRPEDASHARCAKHRTTEIASAVSCQMRGMLTLTSIFFFWPDLARVLMMTS